MNVLNRFLQFVEARRTGSVAAASASTLLIALADWKIEPNVSLGFLHLLPLLLASVHLTRWQIAAMSVAGSALREMFSPFTFHPGYLARILVVSGVFTTAGILVSEMSRNRRLARQRLDESQQLAHRLRAVVDTSPMAIVTCKASGAILLANDSARALLGLTPGADPGSIADYLDLLAQLLPSVQPGWKTELECHGRRSGGDIFLARVWLSGYEAGEDTEVAAVIWDASEELRDRQSATLDSMSTTSRVLLGAVSHELRNLTTAAATIYSRVAARRSLARDSDFNALGSLLEALGGLAASGLRAGTQRQLHAVPLGAVLDELRIILTRASEDSAVELAWRLPGDLPQVYGDHSGLLQVFLNVANNSLRAMRGGARPVLTLELTEADDKVTLLFLDNGPGVENPDALFQAFHSHSGGAGLGLYVSRAIVRSFGGNLRFEPRPEGACFAVDLRRNSALPSEIAS